MFSFEIDVFRNIYNEVTEKNGELFLGSAIPPIHHTLYTKFDKNFIVFTLQHVSSRLWGEMFLVQRKNKYNIRILYIHSSLKHKYLTFEYIFIYNMQIKIKLNKAKQNEERIYRLKYWFVLLYQCDVSIENLEYIRRTQ